VLKNFGFPLKERNAVKQMVGRLAVLMAFASFFISAQTKPTQAEIDQWKNEGKSLESSACKKIAWLLQNEQTASVDLPKQPIRNGLGWCGRGFIEGAAFVIGDDALKKVDEFGLCVDVVAAHIASSCYNHPTKTASEAVPNLLVKVLK